MTAGYEDDIRAPVPAALVGNVFVKQYYGLLAQDPASLHKFYKEQSVFSRGVEGASMESIVSGVGQTEFHNDVMATVGNFEKTACKAVIVSIESQESMQGGVFVLCTGYLTFTHNRETRHFTQAFFLDKQTEPYDGFYVLNDIMRYLSPSQDTTPLPQHARPQEPPVAPQTRPPPPGPPQPDPRPPLDAQPPAEACPQPSPSVTPAWEHGPVPGLLPPAAPTQTIEEEAEEDIEEEEYEQEEGDEDGEDEADAEEEDDEEAAAAAAAAAAGLQTGTAHSPKVKLAARLCKIHQLLPTQSCAVYKLISSFCTQPC
eukprot:gnl/TRDRNA2_/TRDRNA2_172607_c2_seq10.p1 gnl/TRDRNA2_/TRDRNA2_172607_c2~~gnl/TRDRNA2_/TRDRNA2_172607_c2_seq10.p1  ORF type:complete len:314 (+),score=80.10 gnl/TRDRNA2_/TRDRNA2_172607_c2_seq10:112-1053(+)